MASPGAMPAACGLKITMACIPSRIPALSDSRSPPSILLSLGYLPEAERMPDTAKGSNSITAKDG